MKTQKLLKNDLLTINQRSRKVIDINQIIMLKGYANYTCFYLKNGRQRLTAHTLKYYESELDGRGFLRVHRGFIVNQNCILKHDTESSQLFLMEGHEVEISRRRRGVTRGL
ncbi:MAG: LytTR family DNA-binding domain-containing protein [Arcicella sp.]|nr:LytTR family DNA-binding domain-containing protein [Arcicella sp.]